jgi:structural maintenance of chromosome 2
LRIIANDGFRQFGQIFAELLPSNFAKLQPPEGKELTEGLEVKVRLGQVWKQSLTELSGGQRYELILIFGFFGI